MKPKHVNKLPSILDDFIFLLRNRGMGFIGFCCRANANAGGSQAYQAELLKQMREKQDKEYRQKLEHERLRYMILMLTVLVIILLNTMTIQ